MKSILKMIPLLISPCIAFAQGPVPKVWELKSENTVAVAFNPKLKIVLSKLDVDDQVYGRLVITLNYDGANMRKQVNEVSSRFPGAKVQRVIVEPNGLLEVSIPAIGMSKSVQPTPGAEGPYIEDTVYLTKSQYQTLRATFERNEQLVQIKGKMTGNVPVIRIIEEIELPSRTCEELLWRGNNVGSMIQAVSSLMHKPPRPRSIENEETYHSLVQDIQNNCFELAERPSVTSFKALSAVSLRAKQLNRNLRGETLRKGIEKEALDLQFEVEQKGEN